MFLVFKSYRCIHSVLNLYYLDVSLVHLYIMRWKQHMLMKKKFELIHILMIYFVKTSKLSKQFMQCSLKPKYYVLNICRLTFLNVALLPRNIQAQFFLYHYLKKQQYQTSVGNVCHCIVRTGWKKVERSSIMGPQLRGSWNPSDCYSIIVLKGLRGSLN